MGRVHPPTPVKLFCAVLRAVEYPWSHVRTALESSIGPIDFESEDIAFTFTKYYQREMGTDVWRRFVSFQNLADPATLPDMKLATNALESALAS